MFSTATLSRITEELRLAREEVVTLEREAAAARAAVAEWSRLLEFAEATPGPVAASLPLPQEPVDETAPPEPGKQGAGWCWCGLPGTPGMLHNLTECRPIGSSEQLRRDRDEKFESSLNDFNELMGRADERVRGVFEPFTPGSPERPGGAA